MAPAAKKMTDIDLSTKKKKAIFPCVVVVSWSVLNSRVFSLKVSTHVQSHGAHCLANANVSTMMCRR